MVAPVFAAHDASTGFHDVKPLPTFAPIDWWLVAGIALLFALFLAGILYRRHQKMIPPPPPIPPHEEAERNLQQLRARATTNAVTLRALSTEASVIIRTYFERKLYFPATDETTNEVLRNLKQTLHLLTGDATGSELIANATASLRFLDYLTFSNESENRFSATHDEVLAQFDALRAIISTCEILRHNPDGGA